MDRIKIHQTKSFNQNRTMTIVHSGWITVVFDEHTFVVVGVDEGMVVELGSLTEGLEFLYNKGEMGLFRTLETLQRHPHTR